MILKELLQLLNKILQCHPDAENARIWSNTGKINYVGYDNKHKPARIKLEN